MQSLTRTITIDSSVALFRFRYVVYAFFGRNEQRILVIGIVCVVPGVPYRHHAFVVVAAVIIVLGGLSLSCCVCHTGTIGDLGYGFGVTVLRLVASSRTIVGLFRRIVGASRQIVAFARRRDISLRVKRRPVDQRCAVVDC